MNYAAHTLQETALSLFSSSCTIFWAFLPLAFLLNIAAIYIGGEISGGKFESLLRRTLVAILLLTAFPKISAAFQGIETYLVTTFGGDSSLLELFAKVADRARDIKDAGAFSWLKVGQIGITIISTISFLVLAVVRQFLDVLHLTTWNLLHILGPLGLLGCLFPTFSQVPKGIFLGLFELALWKPVWVVLTRILVAIGFGSAPADPSQWFETAVANFAVAGLMASTPALVHGFLNGALASAGSQSLQTMLSGVGPTISQTPMHFIKSARNVAMTPINRTKKWAQRSLSGSRKPKSSPRKNGGHK